VKMPSDCPVNAVSPVRKFRVLNLEVMSEIWPQAWI